MRKLIVGLLLLGTWTHVVRTLPDFGDCSQCIHKVTEVGRKITTVLLFYSYYECTGTPKGTCLHNGTQYKVCSPGDGQPDVCYDPSESPMRTVFEVKRLTTMAWKTSSRLIARTEEKGIPRQVVMKFDACAAMNQGCGSLGWEQGYAAEHKYICQTTYWCSECTYWSCVIWGTWKSDKSDPVLLTKGSSVPGSNDLCTSGHCNPLELTITDPQDPRWEKGEHVMLGIDGKGRDPMINILIQGEVQRRTSSPVPVYQTFYEELNEPAPELPKKTKNLFLQLAENVAQSLNVTSCYVCGGTTMGDRWPWEARELLPSDPVPELTSVQRIQTNSFWVLKVSIIGQYCLARQGRHFTVPVGKLSCLGQQLYNATVDAVTWWSSNHTEKNPLLKFPKLQDAWTHPGLRRDWTAPAGLYWICGHRAYVRLPESWAGSCVIGTIKPSFFLLPVKTGELLGYPVYTSPREPRSLAIGDWKDDEWPPERIIQYYGPATWAQDGSWGYRTPIYIINRIIRLQAVLEIITNETGKALNLLAQQETQMRNAIYQNRLALDYLLAAEGGVCGKFNLTNCCLHIDDQGQAVENIVRDMTALAHVPVQVWHGFDPGSMFGKWFPALGGFKTLIVGVVLVIGVCLLLPCLLPVFLHMLRGLVTTMVHQKTSAQAYYVHHYQSVLLTNQDGEEESENPTK
uniref:Envelope polyprotein n=1 Tax=Callithrix jacchus TaxID=9483 RepID=A0A5F4WCN2_CALJA